VIIAGTGFLADAYDLFVIDLVLAVLNMRIAQGADYSIYSRVENYTWLAWHQSLIASATLVGAVVGQITFGFFGDWFGRKWTFLVTCILIVVGCLGSAFAQWTPTAPFAVYNIFNQIACFRFLLGEGN
jgi:MFS transporter, PHS family, inorganic phosphate transporter